MSKSFKMKEKWAIYRPPKITNLQLEGGFSGARIIRAQSMDTWRASRLRPKLKSAARSAPRSAGRVVGIDESRAATCPVHGDAAHRTHAAPTRHQRVSPCQPTLAHHASRSWLRAPGARLWAQHRPFSPNSPNINFYRFRAPSPFFASGSRKKHPNRRF